jgi:hypothetical protein
LSSTTQYFMCDFLDSNGRALRRELENTGAGRRTSRVGNAGRPTSVTVASPDT